MIASVSGEVIHVGLDHAVIECAGVGYKVLATPNTLSRLPRGEKTRVLTALVVKEDSMTLYGFSDNDNRDMFFLLQTVSGLGAKLAMASLSVFDAGELAQAIAQGDTKRLQTIPGVGKRMAERLALELKDKVSALVSTEPGGEAGVCAPVAPAAGAVVEQVTEALVGLGFTEKAARPVVESILAAEPEMQTAAALRASLSMLGGKGKGA